MNVIFKFQVVAEIVSDGVPVLEANANDVQKRNMVRLFY